MNAGAGSSRENDSLTFKLFKQGHQVMAAATVSSTEGPGGISANQDTPDDFNG